jgi:hypothetical protein
VNVIGTGYTTTVLTLTTVVVGATGVYSPGVSQVTVVRLVRVFVTVDSVVVVQYGMVRVVEQFTEVE